MEADTDQEAHIHRRKRPHKTKKQARPRTLPKISWAGLMMNKADLVEQLIKHEGMRLKPYHCTAGKLTIGVGRNLDDVGINEPEARWLLLNDIQQIEKQLDAKLPWWRNLDGVRQIALADMTFNVGIGTIVKFEKMLNALLYERWDDAATEALDSRWAKQVGQRAETIARQFRTGEYA